MSRTTFDDQTGSLRSDYAMNATDFWTMAGAIGQWAGAIGTVAAVVVALYQTKRANKEQALAERRRKQVLYQALLMEIRENRRILLKPKIGLAKARLHRDAWVATRSEMGDLPIRAVTFLQESYQYASLINDVVTAALSHELGPEYSRLDGDYNKLTQLAGERFRLADRDLSAYLISQGVPIEPAQETIQGALL
jgi:hypothetical protein